MNRFKECSSEDVYVATPGALGDFQAYSPYLRKEQKYWRQAGELSADSSWAAFCAGLGQDMTYHCEDVVQAAGERRGQVIISTNGDTLTYPIWPSLKKLREIHESAFGIFGISLLMREFMAEVASDFDSSPDVSYGVVRVSDGTAALGLSEAYCSRLLGVEKPHDLPEGQWYKHGSLPLFAQFGGELEFQPDDDTGTELVKLRMISPRLASFSHEAELALLTLPTEPLGES